MDNQDINRCIDLLKCSILSNYDKDDNTADAIIIKLLEKAINESEDLSFKEFYKKYLPPMLIFEASDFTCSEIMHIIEETPLSERDKKIAELRYIKLKSEDDIANILLVDKKTVHNNLMKISSALKNTCIKIY